MAIDSFKWFEVANIELLDSPSLLVFEDRLDQNLDWMIQTAGGVERLFPHMKTHKMAEVLRRFLSRGIRRVKCATIAEAELAAREGIPEILVAHALVGPKKHRFVALMNQFPHVAWSTLLDISSEIEGWAMLADKNQLSIGLYLDVNVGMDRSGHPVNAELLTLVEKIQAQARLQLVGFHVYDGHLRQSDVQERTNRIEAGLAPFYEFLAANQLTHYRVIAGGTPAFPVHAQREERYCSPGTGVFWDSGYGDSLPEQGFLPAALVISRVISKPAPGIVTLDAGHKAMASENPITHRMTWLNAPTAYDWKSQSEEHGVLTVEDDRAYQIGDVLYGLPFHICPTVNLYDEAYLIRNHQWVETWAIEGRKRKLTI